MHQIRNMLQLVCAFNDWRSRPAVALRVQLRASPSAQDDTTGRGAKKVRICAGFPALFFLSLIFRIPSLLSDNPPKRENNRTTQEASEYLGSASHFRNRKVPPWKYSDPSPPSTDLNSVPSVSFSSPATQPCFPFHTLQKKFLLDFIVTICYNNNVTICYTPELK